MVVLQLGVVNMILAVIKAILIGISVWCIIVAFFFASAWWEVTFNSEEE